MILSPPSPPRRLSPPGALARGGARRRPRDGLQPRLVAHALDDDDPLARLDADEVDAGGGADGGDRQRGVQSEPGWRGGHARNGEARGLRHTRLRGLPGARLLLRRRARAPGVRRRARGVQSRVSGRMKKSYRKKTCRKKSLTLEWSSSIIAATLERR